VGPKDLPDDITAILENALEKTMKEPSLSESFKKFDIAVEYKNQKEYTSYIEQQDKIYYRLLKEVG
jgi:tripartite-type tricarboxylate transporter receptor subunit TctC